MASVTVSGIDSEKNFPEKLQITPLSPRQQVEAMKQEIRDQIAILRGKLNSLECDLIAEVDRLGALQVWYFKTLVEIVIVLIRC